MEFNRHILIIISLSGFGKQSPCGRYHCQNYTDVRPYPDSGEFCKHVCNCLSAVCQKTVECFPNSSDGECNPGHSRAYCMKTCLLQLYGVWCKQTSNCSEENYSYSRGCPTCIPSSNSNETKATNVKINERFHLRVGAYVFVGITIFVIICIMVELLQSTGKRTNEHMI